MVLSKEGAQLFETSFFFSVLPASDLSLESGSGQVSQGSVLGEPLFIRESVFWTTSPMAQVIGQPVTAPFSLSTVLLSFLHFFVQFLNFWRGALQKFHKVFVDKKSVR